MQLLQNNGSPYEIESLKLWFNGYEFEEDSLTITQ